MEERIIQFITALRNRGIRISLAESSDAFKAVDALGIQNRELFRLSLRSTLIKDASGLKVYDELFPLFFGNNDAPPMMEPPEDLTPEEAEMLAEALRAFNHRLRQLLEKLLKGEQLSEEELSRLSQLVGLDQVADPRYRDWMKRRMEKALQFPQIQEALKDMMAILSEMGMNRQRLEQLRELMEANMNSLKEQVRKYAGQRIAENMSDQQPEMGIDSLYNRPFNQLSESDLQALRGEVSRLAAILRTRIALRQKRAKSGQLDPKATIRANLRHQGVPFVIKRRDRKLKPRLVVICDVSTSMRPMSELMLSLIHSMQDLISKTYAFAFIDRLKYISPELVGKQINEAVRDVLVSMPPGYYNTDLGNSLKIFINEYMETLDSRTTFIIVGDGRNNYNDPRLDIFGQIVRRSNRAIWLVPEPSYMWGTGDSDMPDYYPLCDSVLQVSNLAELSLAVDNLLIQ